MDLLPALRPFVGFRLAFFIDQYWPALIVALLTLLAAVLIGPLHNDGTDDYRECGTGVGKYEC